MNRFKHIFAIIIVLTVLVVCGIFVLPKIYALRDAPRETSEDSTLADSGENGSNGSDMVEDTLSFDEKLQQELQTLKAEYSKRRKRHVWTLGRGKTIIVYLLQTQRFVNKMGGQILHMEEIHDDRSTAFQTAQVDLLNPSGDTLKLELQVSESIFRDDASMLAVAFQVTSLTPELIVALNKLDYPYDLLVPPFGMGEGFYPDLDKVKKKELVLWLTMESSKLNKVHNKLRPLRIHHTAEQIELVIDDAKRLMPKAVGIVSRFGEQAVEHKQLLQAILSPAEKHNLWFLDATTNKLSKVSEACKDLTISCKASGPYNPDNSALSDYIRSKMRESNKKGLAVMIIPLTLDNVNRLSDLSSKAKNQGTTLVNLSTFMKY